MNPLGRHASNTASQFISILNCLVLLMKRWATLCLDLRKTPELGEQRGHHVFEKSGQDT
jgi:hypothetical protein